MKRYILILSAILFLFTSITGIALAGNAIKIFVNGKQIYSDQPPILLKGRTLVPLRVVTEALGTEVNWDGKSQSVVINQRYKPFNSNDFSTFETLQLKHGISITTHLEFDQLSDAYNNLLTCTINLIANNTTEANARFKKANEQLVKAETYELATKELINILKSSDSYQYQNSLDTYTSIRQELKNILDSLSSKWDQQTLLNQFSTIRPSLESLKNSSFNDLINSADAVGNHMEQFRN